jgi:hypothetical protein
MEPHLTPAAACRPQSRSPAQEDGVISTIRDPHLHQRCSGGPALTRLRLAVVSGRVACRYHMLGSMVGPGAAVPLRSRAQPPAPGNEVG